MHARGTPLLRLLLITAILTLITHTHADIYLHHPRGSNNRLNEGGAGRSNNNRLFNSQNNNRGGYNAGSIQRIYYFEGSVVPIEWTQQHSCGDVNGNNCEIIIQYMCGDTDSRVRDGEDTKSMPLEAEKCPNGDCDAAVQYGRHESLMSYEWCRLRSRNRGLFLANQRMRGNSARFTRQNNNGARSGLECPEERDYYPYWHPTIWRDIAILTNNPSRCESFQKASQNVSPRSYCSFDWNSEFIQNKISKKEEGFVPITQEACENEKTFGSQAGAKWVTQEPHSNPTSPPPECIQNAFTRDNHLGNAVPLNSNVSDTAGFPQYYNWTVPAHFSANCVLRLRYNISTGEFPFQGFSSDTDVSPGELLDARSNMVPLNPRNVDNNARYPSMYPIWETYGLTLAENNGSFTERVQKDDPDDDKNGGREGGIRKSFPVSRDYVFRNNPQVDIFGSLLPKNVSTKDPELNGQPMIRLRLAINTAQFGRTFEDRSHVFEIRKRPKQFEGVKIWNLSVRGKRGNIVQVYPGVEYDFVPDRLHVNQGDLVHIQWTGSSPQDGEGQGNKGDRSNILLMRDRNYIEDGQGIQSSDDPLPKYGHWGNAYPARINETAFLGWDITRMRMLALYGLNSSHFDLGAVQVRKPGQYRYLCTRNNAFSNRSQKGLIVVYPNATWEALGVSGHVEGPLPVNMHGETRSESGKAKLVQVEEFNGTLIIPGGVTVADTESSEWIRVNPPVMELGNAPESLMLEVERPMPGNFFYKGQLFWKLHPNDPEQELIPLSSFYEDNNRFYVSHGGYYRSTSAPNSAMIAGVSIGVIILSSALFFLYYKVRVEPAGGWRAFCKRGQNLADADNAGVGSELIPAKATSSSSATLSAAPASSTSSGGFTAISQS